MIDIKQVEEVLKNINGLGVHFVPDDDCSYYECEHCNVIEKYEEYSKIRFKWFNHKEDCIIYKTKHILEQLRDKLLKELEI